MFRTTLVKDFEAARAAGELIITDAEIQRGSRPNDRRTGTSAYLGKGWLVFRRLHRRRGSRDGPCRLTVLTPGGGSNSFCVLQQAASCVIRIPRSLRLPVGIHTCDGVI